MAKRVWVLVLFCLFVAGSLFGQVESGDKEVSFLGYFATVVGENVDPNGFGSLQISYGRFMSKYLEMGIAPTLNFSTVRVYEDNEEKTELDTKLSGSVFFNLNLAAASKTIPYISGQYYQSKFDFEEDEEFSDYSYVNIGFGVKSFFNEYAAFNTQVVYGFSLAEVEDEGSKTGLLMIMTGLSFIF